MSQILTEFCHFDKIMFQIAKRVSLKLCYLALQLCIAIRYLAITELTKSLSNVRLNSEKFDNVELHCFPMNYTE